MFRELRNPLFLILFASMFLTAASELAPGQWVDFALSRTVGMPGILLLVYVSALMFVMRHFAGPLVQRLSPIGLLWWSSEHEHAAVLVQPIHRSPPWSPPPSGASGSVTCGQRCWAALRSAFPAAAPC